MSYKDFTLDNVERQLGLKARPGVLFPDLAEVPVPTWLEDSLRRGMQLALNSEKARSEFIVAPILLAVRDLSGARIAILSGQALDVDAERGLVGECDFILARSEPLPRLRAPLIVIVEAKKNDVESGLGQCIAQMVAAQIFNERSGIVVPAIFGCVTTGEYWQFLRLEGSTVLLDTQRRYINNIGDILAAFQAAVDVSEAVAVE